MADYNYRARDVAGKIITGTMAAENERTVVVRLREQGHMVLDITLNKTKEKKTFKFKRKGVTTKDIAIMSRQFATMVSAGVPLVQCLTILIEQSENEMLQNTMREISLDVESGNTLTYAFKKHSNIFPDVFISLLQVGETTGNLDGVLENLANFYEREFELKEKVRSAMTYPIFVMAMSVLITIGLVVFVLPIFEQVFNDMNVPLPLLTRGLLGLSDIIRSYWYLIPVPLVITIYQVRKYLKTSENKVKYEKIILKLPVISDLMTKLSFSRFTMSLSIMLTTGVPLLQALEVAKDTLGLKIYEKEIEDLKNEVQRGGSMAVFMRRNKIFPPMMARMIAVGENTGSLDAMLTRISEFYEKETRYIIDRLSSLLEPFMIVFLGFGVGLIVISVLLPMFSIIGGIA